MTNQAILTKAIQKAIAGGWLRGKQLEGFELFDRFEMPNDNPDIILPEPYLDIGYGDDYVSMKDVVFNHDFAKALWGEELPEEAGDYYYSGPEENYKWHLQQMVIADDPIAYLGENLDD